MALPNPNIVSGNLNRIRRSLEMAKKYDGNSGIFKGGSEKTALLRIIIPAALAFILFTLSVFFLFIPSVEKQMMDEKRDMIRGLTETAWSLISQYDRDVGDGKFSLKEAQKRIIERMQDIRYGPESMDYFWINDMHPTMVMHPYRSDLTGKDLTEFTDPNGKRLFMEFVRKVQKKKSGYVEYLWQLKGSPDKIIPKLSYVKGFEPWGWIVGTGASVEDIHGKIGIITRRLLLLSGGLFVLLFALSFYVIKKAVHFENKRRIAEKNLMESESRFRTLGEDAPFGISIMDGNMRFEYLNPNFTQIFGYAIDDIPNKNSWFEKAYPEPTYRETVMSTWKKDKDESTGPTEIKPRIYTVHCKNGQDKIIHFRAVQLESSRQLITYEDISDRARAEDALRKSERKFMQLYKKSKRSEELYRSLLHSSADAIVIYDMDGHAQYVSPAFTQIFGWSHEEVTGKRIPFLPESEAERTMHFLRDLVEKGTSCTGFQTKRNTKDGRTLHVSISASRYADHRGKPEGVLMILRDISEMKELEAQFQQAQKMESIGTLAGGVAHDFNNLLMAIQGNASLLLMGKSSEHPDYMWLKKIEKCVADGANLTRQMLGFARGGKYAVETADLNDLLKNSLDLFGSTRKEISITSKYEPGLLASNVDKGQIEQVLMNLYVNASHAMPVGGELYVRTQNVTLEAAFVAPYNAQPGKYVKIAIKDTGTGISPENLKRIFDPFFTTKEVGRGTGLGLASAYGIVRNHEGFIAVKSEIGKGTEFCIYLPAVTETRSLRKATPKKEDLLVRGEGSILLVDDEEIILEVGAPILEKLGYQVRVAKNGTEALEIYRLNMSGIDLVILDMIMPDMSGSEVFDGLKEMNPSVKVLLASGYSIDGPAAGIMARGCNGFIQKPFIISTLSSLLRDILKQ